jgi:tetratricopeptide (TPR) repeat protein
VQLINEHRGKEEIEFLFKHALAQQATYDSILLKSRKALHLKIARSIEKVFTEKINEFYAVLAHHYTMAEQKDQTIKYLILAGDEAARSGASTEALQFYLDALDRMPESQKNSTENEVIRDLEMKIANAYYAVGKPEDAVLRYDGVLKKYFNLNFPDNERWLLFDGLRSAAFIIFVMRNSTWFFRKKLNDQLEVRSRLFNNYGFAVIHSNPRHFMLKGLVILRITVSNNIHRSVPALSFFIVASTVFSMTGLSLKTAERMISFAERTDLENDPQLTSSYYFAVGIYDYFAGLWNRSFDTERIASIGLGLGRYPTVVSWIFYIGMNAVEGGSKKDFRDRVARLDEAAETLDVSYARMLKYRLLTIGCLKFRKLEEAIKAADEGIEYIQTTGHDVNLFIIFCLKAEVCLHLGKIELASTSLIEAEKILGQQKRIPLFHTRFLLSKMHLLGHKILSMHRKDPSYQASYKEFMKSANGVLSKGKKVRAVLTDGYLQRALVFVHNGNEKKAVRDFEKAIQIGENLKSRPDLSRVYFELGKFLLNPHVKRNQLNGLKGEKYLKKARDLFEELDLQWDLERYEAYISGEPYEGSEPS